MSTPEGPPVRKSRAGAIAGGIAVIALGLLIIIPSGLCTAWGGLMGLNVLGQSGEWSLLIVALLLGAVPISFGAVVLWAGLKLLMGK